MDEQTLAKLKALKGKPVAESPLPPLKQSPGAVRNGYNEGIQAMADRKDQSIKRACSLNAAMVMVKAYQEAMVAVGAFNGLERAQIEGLLKALKKAEFHQNLVMLEAKDELEEEIPF